MISKAISVNSTAVLIQNIGSTEVIVSGSKTEGALLTMLNFSFGVDYINVRTNAFNVKRGDRLFTFSSARKKMSVLLVNGNKKGTGVSYTKVCFFYISLHYFLFLLDCLLRGMSYCCIVCLNNITML